MNGINLVGYFDGAFGLGESARTFADSLKKASIPHSLVPADSFSGHHHQQAFNNTTLSQFIYPINVFCIDPRHLFPFMGKYPWKIFKNRYNIAISFWETNIIPHSHLSPWSHFDELWATTRYLQEHLSISNDIPVHHIPHPIRLSYKPKGNKESFGLPNKFTFLFCFCFYSVLGRKNPEAIIEAFKKAFPGRDDVQVVIKSQNGKQYPSKYKALLETLQDDSRFIWMDESLSSERRYDLMDACDCYISLHRSEGFGLTMAEAMLLEKPVIATGYSGNMDFMTDDNSFLCPYRLVTIGRGHPPYSPKGIWADVDVDRAAEWMKYVVDHPEEAKATARQGKASIEKHLSCEVVGTHIARRIAKISMDREPRRAPFLYRKARLFKQIGDTLPFLRPMVKKAKNQLKTIVRKYR